MIRIATKYDFDAILRVIAEARGFIASYGSDQWQDGYPEPELILSDIIHGIGYVFEDDTGIGAYAAMLPGREPIYDHIKGQWLCNAEHYMTVHRLAIGDGTRGRGIGTAMLSFATQLAIKNALPSVRADTHRANLAMQGLLKKNGFVYCGDVLYDVTAGDPLRVCFERLLIEP